MENQEIYDICLATAKFNGLSEKYGEAWYKFRMGIRNQKPKGIGWSSAFIAEKMTEDGATTSQIVEAISKLPDPKGSQEGYSLPKECKDAWEVMIEELNLKTERRNDA